MTALGLKEGVEEELNWLIKKGYIEESDSELASPMVTIRKRNGKIQICVDFRKVNSLTRAIPLHMPRIEEVIESVGQVKIISKMDLSKGYYQVRMAKGDCHKTAFVCHKGKYQFTRMPFGVRNAPAVFQTLMDRVLKELKQFCMVYMDDLIIFSDTWSDHVKHVRKVLDALRGAGLTANPQKCEWGRRVTAIPRSHCRQRRHIYPKSKSSKHGQLRTANHE